MLVADTDITIYHKSYDASKRLDIWHPNHYTGSWYGRQEATVGDKGLNTADSYTVRIPTQDVISASIGDIVVKGIAKDPITGPSQLKQYISFVITAGYDNRRGAPALHHWRLEGK